jgi:glycosyltransferase involved in cell wall biosynthesis
MSKYNGRVALQQRVLPAYRGPFVDELARRCTGGLFVFAGDALPVEQIQHVEDLETAQLSWGVNRHSFQPGHPLYRCRQPGLLGWLERVDPAILVLEANPRYPDQLEAAAWMRARSRAVLGWGLGAPPVHGSIGHLRARARRRLLGQLDGLIAYSKQGAAQYRALNILPDNRIFVAPNATGSAASAAPERAPTPGEPLQILFVGRLQTRKRVDLLIKAVAAVEQEHLNLVIVGDGPARAELEALARDIFPRAHFKGALYDAALDSAYRQADLFVLPGTGGLAVQQALQHGLPVIAAEGDGSQEDMVTSKNGWRIEPGNLDQLKQALASAAADRANLAKMGAASFQQAQNTFNIVNMADGFINALNQVESNHG